MTLPLLSVGWMTVDIPVQLLTSELEKQKGRGEKLDSRQETEDGELRYFES